MNEPKIDVQKYANMHTYYEHVCSYAPGSIVYFPRLKAVYHTSGYLIAENIANMFAFSEFCKAFELGAEIYVNPLYPNNAYTKLVRVPILSYKGSKGGR